MQEISISNMEAIFISGKSIPSAFRDLGADLNLISHCGARPSNLCCPMLPFLPFRRFPVGLLLVIATASVSGAIPDRPDFNFHVQPILSDRCYFCHGTDPAHRKGGLRLDRREEATSVMKSGAVAIIPGDSANSELVKRIFSHDPEEIMPSRESKLFLTDDEREILKRWIDQGAEYKRHWAFETPRMPAIPDPSAVPIDALVSARLQKDGLHLNGEARPERILHRLSMDLTGLPPSIAEMDAFLKVAGTPKAYEKEVDRLLASPAFGERMAQDWLDVARFADTFGYQSDVTMMVWPYRDWVIKSFNENLPYDQFITNQLAGDLLPEPSREQLVATAFNRLHRQTNEGGSIEEEFRVEYVNDRVQTFGLAFLGLTLECCKCHDHKYDPVTTRDYYSLSSFFANIDESGLYSHFTDAIPTPTLPLTTPAQDQAIAKAQVELQAAEEKLTALKATRTANFAQWKTSTPADLTTPGLIGYFPLDNIEGGKFSNAINPAEPAALSDEVKTAAAVVNQGAVFTGENNLNLGLAGNFTRDDAFGFSFWMKSRDVKSRAVIFHRSKAWTDAASCGYELLLEDGRLSAALVHFWPGNAIRVKCVQPLPVGEWTHVAWSYDGSSRAAGLQLFVNGQPAEMEIVRDALTKDINRGGESRVTFGQRFRDRGFKDGIIDELRIYNRALTSYDARRDATGKPNGSDLYDYYLANFDEAWQAQLAEVKRLRIARSNAVNGVPELMVMKEMAKPKPSFILKRGSYESPGDPVTADVPSAVLLFDAALPRNRLGLAKWVTDPRNPLPARVIVNRFWQSLWGTGLVATAEDFGIQGRLPSNPELLDYLARRFVDSGWNVKALLKEIVMSRTYRQDSTVPASVRAQDPENLLLARGPKVRLTAEAVRDQLLAAAQLLDRTIGGPSVDPDNSTRRTLYTFWKRTMPDVRMEIFDMAKREVCIARRQSTNTPLQALTLLNEPKILQASRTLAQLALKQASAIEPRLTLLWRTLIGETPTPAELTILLTLYHEQLSEFSQPNRAAPFLASTGAGIDPTLPPAELAATTTAASAILNLDASIMKR